MHLLWCSLCGLIWVSFSSISSRIFEHFKVTPEGRGSWRASTVHLARVWSSVQEGQNRSSTSNCLMRLHFSDDATAIYCVSVCVRFTFEGLALSDHSKKVTVGTCQSVAAFLCGLGMFWIGFRPTFPRRRKKEPSRNKCKVNR